MDGVDDDGKAVGPRGWPAEDRDLDAEWRERQVEPERAEERIRPRARNEHHRRGHDALAFRLHARDASVLDEHTGHGGARLDGDAESLGRSGKAERRRVRIGEAGARLVGGAADVVDDDTRKQRAQLVVIDHAGVDAELLLARDVAVERVAMLVLDELHEAHG